MPDESTSPGKEACLLVCNGLQSNLLRLRVNQRLRVPRRQLRHGRGPDAEVVADAIVEGRVDDVVRGAARLVVGVDCVQRHGIGQPRAGVGRRESEGFLEVRQHRIEAVTRVDVMKP